MKLDISAATQERIPPHRLPAEASVLGSLMLDRNAVARVADFLRPDDFYLDAHAQVFRAALNLYERSEPIDILTLGAELEKLRTLDRIGGQAFLADLQNAVPTAANVEYYGRLVEEASTKRKLISAGTRITGLGFEEAESASSALDRAESIIFQIAEHRIMQDFVALRDVLKSTWDHIERIHLAGGMVSGVPSGFPDLDSKTAGLQRSELVIIAARPGVGKTSLALNMAQHVAIKEKIPVAIFSLEMSQQQLVQRLLCSEAGVDAFRLRTGMLKDQEWPRIAQAMGALSEAEIYIDDAPNITVMEMRTKARRLKTTCNLGLIIVDYLQMMQGRNQENRVQEISDISRSLKGLARELAIPVIALSQLSREPEKRTDHRPQLADLRESGCLTGDTTVYLPEMGLCRPIEELEGQVGFRVLALNPESWKLEPRIVTDVFTTGCKPVYRLTTQLGRSVRATANHRFLTLEGWRRLDELKPGARIAVPRRLPGPGQATMTSDELALLGHHYCGTTLYKQNVSRERAARLAVAVESKELASLARSDVYWDSIAAIEADGDSHVYDLTVEGLHNFVAADVVLHNSIEQDSDVVLFIYRERFYNPDISAEKRNQAELIIAKNRNGPLGKVDLIFIDEQTRFLTPVRTRG